MDMQILYNRIDKYNGNTRIKSLFDDAELETLKDAGIFGTDTIAFVRTGLAKGWYQGLKKTYKIRFHNSIAWMIPTS